MANSKTYTSFLGGVYMKQQFITGAAVITTSVLLGLGSAGAADTERSDHPDWKFFKKAAQGGMAEVTLGQLAVDKAESEAVKNFGQRMVTDHGKASPELKDLATAENVTLPTEMDAEAKAVQKKLSTLSGPEFDKAYVEEMLKGHKKDISAFEKQAQQGKDPEVKNWAEKTLPTLREHYSLAQTTGSEVGVKSRESSSSAAMGDADASAQHETGAPASPTQMGAADDSDNQTK